jgi:hypothetical protein
LGAVSAGAGWVVTEYKVLRKQFFFEKKNQKTFIYQGQHLICPCEPAACRKEQKFFVSFFQKRNTSFFRWHVSLDAGWYQTHSSRNEIDT